MSWKGCVEEQAVGLGLEDEWASQAHLGRRGLWKDFWQRHCVNGHPGRRCRPRVGKGRTELVGGCEGGAEEREDAEAWKGKVVCSGTVGPYWRP